MPNNQLNRFGYMSNRNKAKPYRPQRLDKKGGIFWADNLPLGAKGENVNTTGCFGIVSEMAIRVKKFGPQKGKRREPKIRKRCKLISTGDLLRFRQGWMKKAKSIYYQVVKILVLEEFIGKPILSEHSRSLANKLYELISSFLSRDDLEQFRKEKMRLEDNVWSNLENGGRQPFDISLLNKEMEILIKS